MPRANLREKGRKTAHGLHDKHSNDSTQTHLATYHVLFGAFVGPGAGVMSLLLLLFVSEKNKLCSGIFRSPIVPNNPKMYGATKHTQMLLPLEPL